MQLVATILLATFRAQRAIPERSIEPMSNSEKVQCCRDPAGQFAPPIPGDGACRNDQLAALHWLNRHKYLAISVFVMKLESLRDSNLESIGALNSVRASS
jgi:hypothetical protein